MLRNGETRGGSRVAPYEPEHAVSGGDEIQVAGLTIEVVDVPGHSAGHVAFVVGSAIFSGDLLFAGSVGRVDLIGGDWETLLDSVRTLVDRFGRDAVVYPGHGPETTLGRELDTNPFLARAPRRRQVTARFQAPRGTHDVLPSEQPLWQRVTGTLAEVAELYGYRRIQTPNFEDTDLFLRARPGSARTSSRRRCTRSPTKPTAPSLCGRRGRRRSPAPTSSTACIATHSR